MPVPMSRRIVIPVLVAVAIAVPAFQAAFGLGLSQAEFASDGNSTLRAAGYAFAIWSVIYAGLIAYAGYQARPQAADSPTLRSLAWPSAVAVAGCAAWIVAAAMDWKWVSLGVIAISASVLVSGLMAASKHQAGRGETIFVLWPLSLLAGWLTIAAAINVLTVLTAEHLIGGPTAHLAGLAGIILVVAIGTAITARYRLQVYSLPIAWGLVGVFVAERSDQPTAAWTALAGSGFVTLVMLNVSLKVPTTGRGAARRYTS